MNLEPTIRNGLAHEVRNAATELLTVAGHLTNPGPADVKPELELAHLFERLDKALTSMAQISAQYRKACGQFNVRQHDTPASLMRPTQLPGRAQMPSKELLPSERLDTTQRDYAAAQAQAIRERKQAEAREAAAERERIIDAVGQRKPDPVDHANRIPGYTEIYRAPGHNTNKPDPVDPEGVGQYRG